MQTFGYGLPRLGEKRQYKTLLERFWSGKITEAEFGAGFAALEKERLSTYAQAVEIYPSGELSLYDPMLDLSVALGLIPERFRPYQGLSSYYQMARGKTALEMTKWFNTNYHYLVPEWDEPLALQANPAFFVEGFRFAKEAGYAGAQPTLIGPYTFLALSKKAGHPLQPHEMEAYAEVLLPIYRQILDALVEAGAEKIFLHEPAFVLDDVLVPLIGYLYHGLSHLPLYLLTYYESVDFYPRLIELPVKGIALDFVSSAGNRQALEQYGFPADKVLIAGVIDGRGVWRADLSEKARFVENLLKKGLTVWVAPSTPLSFLPWSVAPETHLAPELREKLAFATEKLTEIPDPCALSERRCAGRSRCTSLPSALAKAPARLSPADPGSSGRPSGERLRAGSAIRRARTPIQREHLQLPPLPTTTIGSFPKPKTCVPCAKPSAKAKSPKPSTIPASEKK
jgi:5-methyltetrahydropteroyltriglutamate--homocysteine methyltransferase